MDQSLSTKKTDRETDFSSEKMMHIKKLWLGMILHDFEKEKNNLI